MMDESGELLADVHRHLRTFIKPGITSWDIEVFVRDFVKVMVAWRLKLAMKVTNMLPVVVSTTKFATDFLVKSIKDGDLIKVDMCVDLKGAISDSCWSYVVGESTLKLIA